MNAYQEFQYKEGTGSSKKYGNYFSNTMKRDG